MVSINELPPGQRKHSIIVPFLFMKTKNIDFNDKMLKIFIEEMNYLLVEGVSWKDEHGQEHRTRIYPYCTCCDAVMKPKLIGLKSHSGYYCCPLCKQYGMYIYKGGGGSVCMPGTLDEESGLLETAVMR